MGRDKGLFRSEALDYLNNPEVPGRDVRVTKPSVFVVIIMLLMIMTAVFLWGIFGNISDTVSIEALVYPSEGVSGISLPKEGIVRGMFVHDGDRVATGQSLAMVSVGEAYSIITSPQDGVVLNAKSNNDKFEAFESIVTVIGGNADSIRTLVAFVPFELAGKLQPGMRAEVTPHNMTRETDGYVEGGIVDVAQHPVAKSVAASSLKIESYIDRLLADHASGYRVILKMNTDAEGNLAWSYGGQSTGMETGTFCSVQIITKRRSVHEYLFESVRSGIRKTKDMLR